MNRAEEVGGALVVAGDNRPELLESREKVLDQVPCSGQVFVVFTRVGSDEMLAG